jgi:hypothetical protein
MERVKPITYQLIREHGHWRTAKLQRFHGKQLCFCLDGFNRAWPKLRNAKKVRATIHFVKPPKAKRSFKLAQYSLSYLDVWFGRLRRAMAIQLTQSTGSMLYDMVGSNEFWVTIEVLE